MLLAIDVGNSHSVIGIYDGREIIQHWRINTNRNATSDELASLFHSLFHMDDISFSQIQAVIIASVVPPMHASWDRFIKRYFDIPCIHVDNNLDFGIKILIDNPAEIGADRIVNTVAAFSKYQSALIVVDFGTATTFDCVSNTGDYIGGVIAPGLAISLEALGQRTAKLPRIDISSPPENVIGKNTITAIKSGILFGYGGLVEGLLANIKREFASTTPKVIATGGMAGLIAPYAKSIESIEPLLTLEGLRIIYERNS